MLTGMEEEQKMEQKKDRLLPISIIAAALLIGGSVVFSTFYRGGAPAPAGPAVATSTAQGNTGPSAADVAAAMQLTPRDVVLGNADAPVTVIEYGDYQCPFCTQFFLKAQPLIVTNYVNAGKAKLVFRDFPFLDRFPGLPSTANESHDAGAAAECAKDQGKFWDFHNALYSAKAADEAKGGGENDGLYSKSLFVNIANQLGMNISTFTSCIVSGKYADTVNNDYKTAQAAGINSTPTTFVNGVKVVDAGGNSVGANTDAIAAAIDAALKK